MSNVSTGETRTVSLEFLLDVCSSSVLIRKTDRKTKVPAAIMRLFTTETIRVEAIATSNKGHRY